MSSVRSLITAFATVLCCTVSQLVHADPVRVDLDPVRHTSTATLVVEGVNGRRHYRAADLEAIGAHRMRTVTPWRAEEATFDGVLLTDVLSENGLEDLDAIRVVAENDYAVVIPADIWKRWPILLATRVNGAPHTRRERGPIQFVLPMSSDPSAGYGSVINHWVWMAARIEPVE